MSKHPSPPPPPPVKYPGGVKDLSASPSAPFAPRPKQSTSHHESRMAANSRCVLAEETILAKDEAPWEETSRSKKIWGENPRVRQRTFVKLLSLEKQVWEAFLTHYDFIVALGMSFYRCLRVLISTNEIVTAKFVQQHQIVRCSLDTSPWRASSAQTAWQQMVPILSHIGTRLPNKVHTSSGVAFQQTFSDERLKMWVSNLMLGNQPDLLTLVLDSGLISKTTQASGDMLATAGIEGYHQVVRAILRWDASSPYGLNTYGNVSPLMQATLFPQCVYVILLGGATTGTAPGGSEGSFKDEGCTISSEVVNHQSRYGHTALHEAVNHFAVESGRLLLALGHADPNIQDSLDGSTPLHCAVEVGCLEFVQLLLSHGADMSLPDAKGNTAMDLAIGEEFKEALHLASTILRPSGIQLAGAR